MEGQKSRMLREPTENGNFEYFIPILYVRLWLAPEVTRQIYKYL